MSSREDRALEALAIMRRWNWNWFDPDGMFETDTMELCEVVNRLAMEGVSRPEYALLPLLGDGRVKAQADYHWRKYEAGRFYQMEGRHGEVPIKRWRQLIDAIEWEAREIAGDGFGLESAILEKLDLGECYPFEMNVQENRFSLAICPPETDWRAPGYSEEWFSAQAILLSIPESPSEPIPYLAELPPAIENKGGAPRKWDWDGALLHLAALAHSHPDGLLRSDCKEPTASDIARHIGEWFMETTNAEPSDSHLREYGARFLAALNALKLKAANNPDKPT